MKKPASECRQCDHWDETRDAYKLPPCGMGHKPRFYMPRWVEAGNKWGSWKRKCDDFKKMEHDDNIAV